MRNAPGISGWFGVVCLTLGGPATYQAAGQGGKVINSIGMELAPIPSGKFLMGSPTNEPGREEDEDLRTVTLTKPFHLGSHEVTQAQYALIMGGDSPSYFKGKTLFGQLGKDTTTSRYPVDTVSHADAKRYCERLSGLPAEKAAGRMYRLPTEAEWEYCCRAGSTTRFHFGDDEASLGIYAWHKGNSDKQTHPVGLKKANAWGLYDMHGNVWEWCADWYEPNPRGEAIDPQGQREGSLRVLRGGDWFSGPDLCRSAERYWIQPTDRGFLGFRVAMTVSGSEK